MKLLDALFDFASRLLPPSRVARLLTAEQAEQQGYKPYIVDQKTEADAWSEARRLNEVESRDGGTAAASYIAVRNTRDVDALRANELPFSIYYRPL